MSKRGFKMQIDDYFDFLASDDIRLKGSRIGIETVLYEYIHKAKAGGDPEQLSNALPRAG